MASINNVKPVSIRQAPFNSATGLPLFTVNAVKDTPVTFDAHGNAVDFKKDWYSFVVTERQATHLAYERKVQVIAASEDKREWTSKTTGEKFVTTRILDINRFEAKGDLRLTPLPIKWNAPEDEDLVISMNAAAPQEFIDQAFDLPF